MQIIECSPEYAEKRFDMKHPIDTEACISRQERQKKKMSSAAPKALVLVGQTFLSDKEGTDKNVCSTEYVAQKNKNKPQNRLKALFRQYPNC